MLVQLLFGNKSGGSMDNQGHLYLHSFLYCLKNQSNIVKCWLVALFLLSNQEKLYALEIKSLKDTTIINTTVNS